MSVVNKSEDKSKSRREEENDRLYGRNTQGRIHDSEFRSADEGLCLDTIIFIDGKYTNIPTC